MLKLYDPEQAHSMIPTTMALAVGPGRGAGGGEGGGEFWDDRHLYPIQGDVLTPI